MKAELHTDSFCRDKRLRELLLRMGVEYQVMVHDTQQARTAAFDHMGLKGLDRTLPKVHVIEPDSRRVVDLNGLLRLAHSLDAPS